jgi:hypothetical protein
LPHHGAAFGIRPVLEVHDRRADLYALADFGEQLADVARFRGRDFDDGLIGLDRQQGLIDNHMIAFPHVPADDLSFNQAFTEIRECEGAHEYAMVRRTASRTESTLGM